MGVGPQFTELTGQVLYPKDKGFEEAWCGYNARHHGRDMPMAIVYCQDVQDVQNAVLRAREERKRNPAFQVRVRCGGHDYEGWSSNVLDGLIIDVSMMESMKFHRRPGQRPTLAEVGAGLEMQLLTERLWDAGVGLPLATSPDVGIAGLTLGGGFGPTSRKWGLTCDQLAAVQIVLANGRVIEATEKRYRNLFWACHGAGGGNFGVVTRFTFKVHPVDKVVLFKAFWPGFARLEELVRRWQCWAPRTKDERFTSLLRMRVAGVEPDGTPVPAGLLMVGQYTFDVGDTYDASRVRKEIHEKLFQYVPPLYTAFSLCDHVEAAREYFLFHPRKNQRRAVREHSIFERYKAASSFAMKPLPRAGIRELKRLIQSYPRQSLPLAQPPMIQLLSGGGKVRGDAAGTALGRWRNARFVLQFDGYWSACDNIPNNGDDREDALKWVKDARQAMLPWSEGAYIGYLDEDLGVRDPNGKSPPAWLETYFDAPAGSERRRRLQNLQRIKATYDPDDLFRFPQGIPPAPKPAS